ncbi:hypothetical protein F4802DRAFT_555486 [Xylaria palmicola]|nr:hypothetical protein F4802DRAFT_555486 [Xylaria palmicola]
MDSQPQAPSYGRYYFCVITEHFSHNNRTDFDIRIERSSIEDPDLYSYIASHILQLSTSTPVFAPASLANSQGQTLNPFIGENNGDGNTNENENSTNESNTSNANNSNDTDKSNASESSQAAVPARGSGFTGSGHYTWTQRLTPDGLSVVGILRRLSTGNDGPGDNESEAWCDAENLSMSTFALRYNEMTAGQRLALAGRMPHAYIQYAIQSTRRGNASRFFPTSSRDRS